MLDLNLKLRYPLLLSAGIITLATICFIVSRKIENSHVEKRKWAIGREHEILVKIQSCYDNEIIRLTKNGYVIEGDGPKNTGLSFDGSELSITGDSGHRKWYIMDNYDNSFSITFFSGSNGKGSSIEGGMHLAEDSFR